MGAGLTKHFGNNQKEAEKWGGFVLLYWSSIEMYCRSMFKWSEMAVEKFSTRVYASLYGESYSAGKIIRFGKKS